MHSDNDDKQLTEVFSRFKPELPDSDKFMQTLESNLDSVEFIRKNHLVYTRKNRLAVLVSGMAGFLAGVIMTVLFPFVNAFSVFLISSIPDIPEEILINTVQITSWAIIALVAVAVSLSGYEIMTRQQSALPAIPK